MKKHLFISQNSYYFVHKHFINFFENNNNEVIFVSENKRALRKYKEIIRYFGISNFIKAGIYELFYMCFFYRRKRNLKHFNVKDRDLNDFIKKLILENNYESIISIGCPCFINPDLMKDDLPIYNLHGGIIPYQRGKYSPIKSLEKGHVFLGSSIHLIDNKFDSGKILSQDYFKSDSTDKLQNYNKVLNLSSGLLKKFLKGEYKCLPNSIKNYFK